ncbi:MAG: preprotein translocase subunit SecY, partial [Pseudomonadota bacterium]
MAKNRKNEEMAAGLAQSGKLDELRQRLMFLIGALIVYRIGTFVPVPGIDPLQLTEFFEQQSGNILAMFNMFSGGALQRFGIFALGVMPYISASIVMQMAAVVVPSLAKLKKEGESGRRKITDYTRRGTLLLALIQSFGAAYAIQNQPNLVVNPGISFMVLCIISLVTGTMFLMWLGEQITERGVGNGISIIILAGIIAGMPGAIAGTAELVSNGTMSPALALIILIAFIAMTVFVVYMESAQRRITVHYARRQQGRRMMQAQSTHLPFKVNMSGVIPPIFASSLLLFPVTLVQFSGANPDPGTLTQTLQRVGAALSPGQPIYIVLY